MFYIYKITNIINNKIYIGQSKYDNPKYLGSGNYIRKAVKKYGFSNFKKEIIQECIDLKHSNEREKYWISILDSKNSDIGYNIADGGASFIMNDDIKNRIKKTLTGKYIGDNSFRKGIQHDEVTKQKISESNKGRIKSKDTRKKMSISATGRKLNESTRKKLSDSHKGKVLSFLHKEKISEGLKGKVLLESTKKKIKESNVNKIQKIALFVIAENITTKEILYFNSCSSAAKNFCTYRQKIKNNLINGWNFVVIDRNK